MTYHYLKNDVTISILMKVNNCSRTVCVMFIDFFILVTDN